MKRRLTLLVAAAALAAGCEPLVLTFGRRGRGPLPPGERAFLRAEREYLRAAERNPRDPAAPAALGGLYHYRGSFAAAEKHYRRALELSPRFYAARVGLAWLYLETSREAQALQEAKLAIESGPGDVAAYVIGARVHVLGGNLAAARALLGEALEIDPESPEVLLFLAELDRRDRDYAAAEKRCRRVLAADGKNLPARCDLALVLASAGRAREAVRQAETAVRLNGAEAAHWEILGWARQAAKDVPGAEAAYRKALALEPDRVSARKRLAELLEGTGRTEDALREYREAAARAPRRREVLLKVAELARLARRPRDELAARLQLARAFPEDIEVQRAAARALERAGAAGRALSAWERVLKLAAGDLEAHRALAGLWG